MSKRAKELSLRLQAFTDEVVGFVQGCSDADWRKVCKEDWTVGVTARHIGATLSLTRGDGGQNLLGPQLREPGHHRRHQAA